MVESGFIVRADGGRMAYRRFGSGPPLVCIAGGPGADARYLEDLAGLAEEFELIVPDARGTGRSDPAEPADGYGFDRQADDLLVLLSSLELDAALLLAHSAACTTALVFAARWVERLSGLVLVTPSRHLYPAIEDDTGAILERRRGADWFEPAARALRRIRTGVDPDEMPELLAQIAPAAYNKWGEREQAHSAITTPEDIGLARRFWEGDVDGDEIRSRLRSVGVPVLTITGEFDVATGINAGVEWAALFRNGRHLTIENAGHNPWIDQPAAFREAVTRFLGPIGGLSRDPR